MGGQIGASGLENLLSEDEQAPLRGWALGGLVMLGHQCTPTVTTKCFWTIRPVFNMAGVSEKPLVDRISEWGGRIGGSGLNLLSEDGQSCWAATTVPPTNIKYSCGFFGGKFATVQWEMRDCGELSWLLIIVCNSIFAIFATAYMSISSINFC